MPNTLGNDISKYQGDVNFDTFKNNSQFVIIKASEGVGYIDPKANRNKAEARRVGMLLGYYHFARPDLGNSGAAEADSFLKAINDFKDGELLALDYEANWNGDVVAWCKAFLDRIRERLNGYNALIYLNQSHMGKNWKPVIDAGNGLWIAAYTFNPNNNSFNKGQWPFAAMQQWTNNQSVPGISGGVDGNVFFGDMATLRRYCYKAPVTPPTPTPNPPTNADDERALKILREAQVEFNYGNLEGTANGLRGAAHDLPKVQSNLQVANDKIAKIKAVLG